MDKESLKYKIFLTLAVLAITVVFFLIVPQFYDNSHAEYTYTLLEDGTVAIDGYSGEPSTLEVPGEIDGYTVSAISESAFANKSGLRKVILPETLKKIGDYAFYDCTGLTSVEAAGLEQIGHSAFYGCSALKKVTWSEELTHIGDSAFASCTKLASLTVPSSCEYIGTNAFMACESLVLDCSLNALAAEVAQQYGIPTDFSESDEWLLLRVGLLTLGAAAVMIAVLILFNRRKKSPHNAKKI